MKTEPKPSQLPDQDPQEASAVAADAGRMKAPNGWRVLRHRDYSLLFWGQLISAAGTQIQVVVVLWQVGVITRTDVAHEAFALGLVGLFSAVPRLLFSLVGGVFADLLDRRKMLLTVNLLLACSSVVLAVTTQTGTVTLPIIYAMVLLSACLSSFEFPTRQAIIPTLVPREEMPAAISLSMVMMQLTFIAGATLGGFCIALLGIANSYWLDVGSYFVVVAALLVMNVPRVPAERRAQGGIAALVDGMRFLRAHPVILAVLSLDFFATFFGSPRALFPVYADQILHVGPQGLGVLAAATSVGAVALAPFTGVISRIPRQGLGVALAIVGWGLFIVAFGLSTGPLWLSAFFLAGAGAADMVSMVLRALVVQLTTPDEFRGRISAVNAMFVIGGPSLGQFESGVVASVATPQLSVVSGGILCIVATAVIVAVVPGLLRVRVR